MTFFDPCKIEWATAFLLRLVVHTLCLAQFAINLTLPTHRPPQCAWSVRLSRRHMCLNDHLSGTFWSFPRILLSWKWHLKQQKTWLSFWRKYNLIGLSSRFCFWHPNMAQNFVPAILWSLTGFFTSYVMYTFFYCKYTLMRVLDKMTALVSLLHRFIRYHLKEPILLSLAIEMHFS